jgi:hypothetical protein
MMKIESGIIRVRGKDLSVPAVRIENCTVISTGRLVKVAQLFDEDLVDKGNLMEPLTLISELRASPLPADIFTFAFARRLKDSDPLYDFPFDWDNLAVLSTTPYERWWKGLATKVRQDVNRSVRKGVVVKEVPFDESLVRGIKAVYDETPIRQGRPFWHYHKDLGRVRLENATYLERSHFFGAFLNDQLIGFLKYVKVDNAAVMIQILAMEAHREKRPNNALLKHAVEHCNAQGLSELVYGKFAYEPNEHTPLSDFKRRNGFRERRFRRYYVPLTVKGHLAIKTGLHLGLRRLLPASVVSALRESRRKLWKTVDDLKADRV